MTNQDDPRMDRILELLAARATGDLSVDEQKDLSNVDWDDYAVDRDVVAMQMEVSAAAFDLALTANEKMEDESMALPPSLRDKILVSANEYFATDESLPASHSHAAMSERPVTEKVVVRSVIAPPSWRETLAILAAAACLFILIGNINGLFDQAAPVDTNVAARQKMDDFGASTPIDMLNVDWTENVKEGVEPLGITGKVVWSDARQEGYMVFSGLPKNDPSVEQYQLWIFDSSTEQVAPTDGGVFDISEDGEVIIRIDAQHPVKKAVMFAVTIEQPGGVQRSTRERLPALAVVSN